MAGEPVKGRAHAVLALVADDDLHLGRLADEGAERFDPFLRDLAEHRPHADAADLLVIGDRQMDRRRELGLDHLRHHGQTHRDEALHVGGAAAIELAVALDQLERIVAPVLTHHRYDVGMARQHQARAVRGANRDPQRSLLSGCVHKALALDAEPGEIALDVCNQRQVGAIADGVEGDEVGEEFSNPVGS